MAQLHNFLREQYLIRLLLNLLFLALCNTQEEKEQINKRTQANILPYSNHFTSFKLLTVFAVKYYKWKNITKLRLTSFLKVLSVCLYVAPWLFQVRERHSSSMVGFLLPENQLYIYLREFYASLYFPAPAILISSLLLDCLRSTFTNT